MINSHRLRRVAASIAALAVAAGLAVAAPESADAVTPQVGTWVAQPTLVVLNTTQIAAHGTLTFTVTGVPAGATAALHLVVAKSQTTGWIAAYQAGGSSNVSVVNYVPGQQPSGLALVKTSASGTVTISNHSNGWVQVNGDRTGYYVGGSPAPTAPGSFVPLTSSVVLNTTTIGAGKSVSFHVPAPAGSTVALHGVVASSTTSGWLATYPDGGSSNVSFLNYVHGQQQSNLTLVQVAGDGAVVIANHSSGPVSVNADVSGYYVGGAALEAHTFVSLPSNPVFDTRRAGGAIAANATRTFAIAGGLQGIPIGATVALHVVIASSTANGWVAAYPDNGSSNASVVNYTHGQQASNLAFVTVGTGGGIKITNHSSGSVQVAGDIIGYHRTVNGSPGHYVRNLTGAATDATKMQAEGAADAAAGATFVLLHIGAQANDQTGVVLSATSTKLTYAQLHTALQAYLTGFGAVTNASVVIATNNGADDWTNYTAAQRGADWADKVVDTLTPGAGVTVAGADDIESGFFSTEAQAEGWESAYLTAATTKQLVYVGSADGCPTTFGSTAACSFGWTQAQYYKLAGGLDPTHIHVLPQIYTNGLATQWANIDHTGGGALNVLGSLTEYGACGSSCSLTPDAAWFALHNALALVPATPGTLEVDLRIDS